MSRDLVAITLNKSRMARPSTNREYQAEFKARVRQAREGAGYTQGELADLLGIAQDTYKQYETRSLLPHRLIRRFCLACRIDESWLISGEGPVPPTVRALDRAHQLSISQRHKGRGRRAAPMKGYG